MLNSDSACAASTLRIDLHKRKGVAKEDHAVGAHFRTWRVHKQNASLTSPHIGVRREKICHPIVWKNLKIYCMHNVSHNLEHSLLSTDVL